MIGGRKCKIKNVKCKIYRGFTLIEVLVALSLFAIVVTISTELFLSFQRSNRKTQNLELVVTNARLVVERLARELREGSIAYATFAQNVSNLDLSQPQTQLYIRSNSGTALRIYEEDDQDNITPVCPDEQSRPCIVLNSNDASESLTGTGVRLREVRFLIVPSADPFEFASGTGEFRANIQPRVTIYLSFENTKDPMDQNYARYDVQTTISSRIYRR